MNTDKAHDGKSSCHPERVLRAKDLCNSVCVLCGEDFGLNPCKIRVNPWRKEFDLRPPTRHHRLRHRPAPAATTSRPPQRRKNRRRPPPARTQASNHARPQRESRERNRLPELLAQRGVELFECDRGGDVTFHGPGQLVGYPIFDLRRHARVERRIVLDRATSAARKHLGAVDFVRRLEEVLIRTCADFAIATKRVPGLTGVWTDPGSANCHPERTSTLRSIVLESKRTCCSAAAGTNPEAKLAAIGIHISRFVTSHGFALNVNTDLSYFNLIIPCGITSKPVTSMQVELDKPLDLNAVAESISRNFGTVFSSQISLARNPRRPSRPHGRRALALRPALAIPSIHRARAPPTWGINKKKSKCQLQRQSSAQRITIRLGSCGDGRPRPSGRAQLEGSPDQHLRTYAHPRLPPGAPEPLRPPSTSKKIKTAPSTSATKSPATSTPPSRPSATRNI